MSQNAVSYQIIPYNPQAHLFRIKCTIENPDQNGQRISLPAWIPGSYMIREFAKHVVRLSACTNDQAVAVNKLDKQTWQCARCEGPLTIEYDVYAWDLSVRQAHLDTRHAFFNGTSVFVAVEGQENLPCRVNIQLPSGNQYLHWRVATAMKRDGANLFQPGWYYAADYDELVDHPVEMGDFEIADFEVAGVPHHFVVTGRHYSDLKRIAADIKPLCEHHVEMFGELPEMERYLFLLTCVGEGYGGLEHRACCSLISTRSDLPRAHETHISEEYQKFLGLCSHEYFHTWNVKRIKPKVFVKPKLNQEAYTRLLWAFEGITSYYDDLSLLRVGMISRENYLDVLARQITRYLRTPGRHQQSVAESSFEAWTKFYKQDENSLNAIVSYYNKGALVACLLDLEIRRQTNHMKSLDDVMRQLWIEYGKPGIGIDETELQNLISTMTGLDLNDFFERTVSSCAELEFKDIFSEFGVSYTTRAPLGLTDLGGRPWGNCKSMSSYFGFDLKARFGPAVLAYVLVDSPFCQAGFAAGDVLIALDRLQVDAVCLESRLLRYKSGDSVHVHVFRGDELIEADVLLQAAQQSTCCLQLSGDADAWLGKGNPMTV